IVMHLVYFAPALLFGFYYLFHGDISVKQFRELLSSEHAADEVDHERNGKREGEKARKGESETERRRDEAISGKTNFATDKIANRKSQIENL
ncbi:MAG TPA: hypothetical protein PKE69_00540, partial [Pyrinomonadaceae bacterium]|nr:hypothetical protein [Pyrinomonadaceae bacterium]